MDIAFSIISGLFLRASANGVHVEPLGKLAAALVGIWEGMVVHQLSSRSSSEVDHYLAYGLRVVIDFVVSNDQSKTIMILVWTALGAFASESVTPRSSLRAPLKRERRGRSSRARPSYRATSGPALAATTSGPRLPLFPPNLQSATPQVPISKPPTPPSFFLGAGSDFSSPIPAQVHPLDLSPTRPPTGLASQLEKAEESDSPAPKPVLLPTPPQSNPSDGLEYGNSRPTTSPHRLSTIHEISSAAERTPHPEEPRKIEKQKEKQEQLPEQSQHSSPLPIPNLTMNGFSISNPFQNNDDDDDNNDGIQHSTPFSTALPVPVPVPNMSTSNRRPHIINPLDVNDPLMSPPWDNDDALDELCTPPPRSYNGIELVYTDMDDPLRTPLTMPHMLSPLVLEEELGSSVPLVSVISGPMPSISQVQALAESIPVRLLRGQAGPSTQPLGALLLADIPATPTSPKAQDPPSDPESAGAHSDVTSVFSTAEPSALTRKAEKLRQEARVAEKEYDKLRQKYREAVKEDKTAEAFILKRKMYDAEEKARESHKKAARRYFASLNELNPKKKEDTVDVHGLRPAEAIDRTERALSAAMNNGLATLRVIVGKGLHSVGGQPVLKQVITRAMASQKIDCQVDSRNAGVLILSVPSQ